ncbi:MAG: phosphoglycerate mutase family protein [Gammaproteobacteria bacterium]|nr:phosphoglycerate mutase family protein [Gammaproteobacteria bacterium]MDH5630238.1 phosphoglycerate mutase family protein [Gammaproteobacteria bacterium]
MSHIYLIRHGQASFGQANYDKLSDLGRKQAQTLGEYFAYHQIAFDLVMHGTMERQADTALLMAETAGHNNGLTVEPLLNEFDSDNLAKTYLPEVLKNFPKEVQEDPRFWLNQSHYFNQVFGMLVNTWQQDNDCPFESWQSFSDRAKALHQKLSSDFQHCKKIALVTSGGMISLLMKSILGYDNQKFTEMNLTINNASVTEVKLTDDGFRLINFNNVSALMKPNDKQLITLK